MVADEETGEGPLPIQYYISFSSYTWHYASVSELCTKFQPYLAHGRALLHGAHALDVVDGATGKSIGVSFNKAMKYGAPSLAGSVLAGRCSDGQWNKLDGAGASREVWMVARWSSGVEEGIR
jgi:hypothetical protein